MFLPPFGLPWKASTAKWTGKQIAPLWMKPSCESLCLVHGIVRGGTCSIGQVLPPAPPGHNMSNRRWSEPRERNRRTVTPFSPALPGLNQLCSAPAGLEIFGGSLSAGSALARLAFHRRLLTLRACSAWARFSGYGVPQ